MKRDGLLTVDTSLAEPVHLQISEQIQAMIERGELRPDARLPAIRRLAHDLGIAPNTVMRAYSALHEAQFIVADAQRGTRVAPNPPRVQESREASLRAQIMRLTESLRYRGFSKTQIATAFFSLAEELRA